MNFKPFEIWSCQPEGWDKPHPCVIVSHPDRADRRTPVEVLMCASQRASRPADGRELILDEADGLDWPTLCKCEPIVSLPRENVLQRRGEVTLERRGPLLRTVISAPGWTGVLAR
jgi:mRNA-degrading endonuclease toxin of MazEF toxin-antitoxin module